MGFTVPSSITILAAHTVLMQLGSYVATTTTKLHKTTHIHTTLTDSYSQSPSCNQHGNLLHAQVLIR